MDARLVIFVPEQKPRDRDRGDRETDDDDRDIGQKEPGRDAARHRLSRRHELVSLRAHKRRSSS